MKNLQAEAGRQALVTALGNAAKELRNVHADHLARTVHAPTGCPCSTGAPETCPLAAAIAECDEVLCEEGETEVQRRKQIGGVVTAETLAEYRETLPRDQAAEIEPGCVTWAITYEPGAQRGQMTVWPATGRAAIYLGGASAWGEWDNKAGVLTTDDGGRYDEDGQLIR